jgi:hypothetical protein
MKRLAILVALSATVVTFGSERLKSRTVATPSGAVRLTIPRAFEPLLPGSAYPDRHRPADPKGCAIAIVERGLLSAETREFFLERGFVVAEARRETLEAANELFAALALEGAADPVRSVVLCRGRIPAALATKVRAAAILDPSPEARHENPRPPTELFLLTPARAPSDALTEELRRTYGTGAIEKWYRSETGFPREAFRDAAEWLAIEVGAR